MKYSIQTEKLSCGYDFRNPILSDVNLKIQAGEFCIITGPNGSGKTTLFKTLTGLQPPISGKFSLSFPKELALVPQSKKMNLHFPLLVRDVLSMSEKSKNLFPWEKSNRFQYSDELIDKMDLYDILEIPIRECSGGQLQRVLITRAFLDQPKILFLDEPMDALDQKSLVLLNRMLHDLTDEGKTIIVITHHTPELMRSLCTSQLVVDEGKVSSK